MVKFLITRKILLVGRDGELQCRPVAPRVVRVEIHGYAVVMGCRGAGGWVAHVRRAGPQEWSGHTGRV